MKYTFLRPYIKLIFTVPYSDRFSTNYYLRKLKWLGVSTRINNRFVFLKVII